MLRTAPSSIKATNYYSLIINQHTLHLYINSLKLINKNLPCRRTSISTNWNVSLWTSTYNIGGRRRGWWIRYWGGLDTVTILNKW